MKLFFYISIFVNHLFKAYFQLLFQTLLFKSDSKTWKLFIERLSNPVGIPYAMFNAPRWNTHAFIASIGPISIEKNIKLDFSEINKHCSSWTFIVYRIPKNKTCKVLTSISIDKLQNHIHLEKGKYSLVFRCYEVSYPLVLPAIEIDEGKFYVEKRTVSQSVPVFPESIINRKSLFYTFVHYYLHFTFKNSVLTNNQFLEREYLPVGNPETTYKFGYFQTNQALAFQFNTSEKDYLAYMTCYNTSSFPIFTEKIELSSDSEYHIPEFDCDGTYLIRLIPLSANLNSEILKNSISVLSKYSDCQPIFSQHESLV